MKKLRAAAPVMSPLFSISERAAPPPAPPPASTVPARRYRYVYRQHADAKRASRIIASEQHNNKRRAMSAAGGKRACVLGKIVACTLSMRAPFVSADKTRARIASMRHASAHKTASTYQARYEGMPVGVAGGVVSRRASRFPFFGISTARVVTCDACANLRACASSRIISCCRSKLSL